jgi:hypothetical protein
MGGYTNQKGIGLYATTGTTDDWAYAATSALGYTLEHGTAFHPPYAGGVVKSFKGVLRAYMTMARAAADPDLHAVISGRVVGPGGRPVGARLSLTKRFRTPLGHGNPTGKKFVVEKLATAMRARRSGGFVWHVNPSTRPIVLSRRERQGVGLTPAPARRAPRGARIRSSGASLAVWPHGRSTRLPYVWLVMTPVTCLPRTSLRTLRVSGSEKGSSPRYV